MARLKVYRAHMGFFDTVVAAPSQKAALEAWGTRQNLFGEGLAEVTTDQAAVNAALKHPGVAIRRAAGTRGRFVTEAEPPGGPVPPKREPAKAAAARRTNPPKPKPRPDRSRLSAAEQALEKAARRHETASKGLNREIERLEARRRDLDDAWRVERRALERDMDKARRAYDRARGE